MFTLEEVLVPVSLLSVRKSPVDVVLEDVLVVLIEETKACQLLLQCFKSSPELSEVLAAPTRARHSGLEVRRPLPLPGCAHFITCLYLIPARFAVLQVGLPHLHVGRIQITGQEAFEQALIALRAQMQ